MTKAKGTLRAYPDDAIPTLRATNHLLRQPGLRPFWQDAAALDAALWALVRGQTLGLPDAARCAALISALRDETPPALREAVDLLAAIPRADPEDPLGRFAPLLRRLVATPASVQPSAQNERS